MANEASQRALRLTLFLLCNGAKTREEIMEQVQGYQGDEEAARRRFERDLIDVEEAGFLVFKTRKFPRKYWIRFERGNKQ